MAGVSSGLADIGDQPGPGSLAGFDFEEQLLVYLEAARAPNTLKAYRSDWAEFEAW